MLGCTANELKRTHNDGYSSHWSYGSASAAVQLENIDAKSIGYLTELKVNPTSSSSPEMSITKNIQCLLILLTQYGPILIAEGTLGLFPDVNQWVAMLPSANKREFTFQIGSNLEAQKGFILNGLANLIDTNLTHADEWLGNSAVLPSTRITPPPPISLSASPLTASTSPPATSFPVNPVNPSTSTSSLPTNVALVTNLITETCREIKLVWQNYPGSDEKKVVFFDAQNYGLCVFEKWQNHDAVTILEIHAITPLRVICGIVQLTRQYRFVIIDTKILMDPNFVYLASWLEPLRNINNGGLVIKSAKGTVLTGLGNLYDSLLAYKKNAAQVAAVQAAAAAATAVGSSATPTTNPATIPTQPTATPTPPTTTPTPPTQVTAPQSTSVLPSVPELPRAGRVNPSRIPESPTSLSPVASPLESQGYFGSSGGAREDIKEEIKENIISPLPTFNRETNLLQTPVNLRPPWISTTFELPPAHFWRKLEMLKFEKAAETRFREALSRSHIPNQTVNWIPSGLQPPTNLSGPNVAFDPTWSLFHLTDKEIQNVQRTQAGPGGTYLYSTLQVI